MGQFTKNYRTFYPQKIVIKLSKIWFGIRHPEKKSITDPGSRVKKTPDPVSGFANTAFSVQVIAAGPGMDPGATDLEPEKQHRTFLVIFGHQKPGSWSGSPKRLVTYASFQLSHTSPLLMRYILNSVGDPDPD